MRSANCFGTYPTDTFALQSFQIIMWPVTKNVEKRRELSANEFGTPLK